MTPAPLSKLARLNLALRALMESGIVLGLAYWGFRTGTSAAIKTLLAIGAPLLGFGLWSIVDFRWAGTMSELLRLFEELAISGLAAVAVYASGLHALGWALGLVSVVHHALIYLLGERLLKR